MCKQVIGVCLIAILVSLVACQGMTPEPEATPTVRPSFTPLLATPSATAAAASPTVHRSPTAKPTRTVSPAPSLPPPVAAFLRGATPVPAIASPGPTEIELQRQFNEPPYVFLEPDPYFQPEPFDLTPASIPPGFVVESVADNADKTLRAVSGVDTTPDLGLYQLYIVRLSTGEVYQALWETYADYRPIDGITWLGDDTLVFSQWFNPHDGGAWAFDVSLQQIILKEHLVSPEMTPVP